MTRVFLICLFLIFAGCASVKGPSSEKAQDAGAASWKNIPVGSEVKIVLRDGDTVEGKLVEQGYDYVRVYSGNQMGIPMTYLKDMIWKMQAAGSDPQDEVSK